MPARGGMQRLPQSRWTDLLTIVVSSSPVPSNPDTSTLRAGFESLRLVPGLPSCAKLIQFDGPQASLPTARVQQYSVFKERVRSLAASDPAFKHTVVYASNEFLFASHNLAAAVSRVNTTFFFSLQHDYQLARPFDAPRLLRSMLAVPVIKHVRLNMRSNAPARGFDGAIANATLRGLEVPLTRTCGWSDAPHIARTDYYINFVIPRNFGDHNHGRRKFMEESLHYPMQRNFLTGGCWELKQQIKAGVKDAKWPADFDDYGTYLYGLATRTDGSYTVHRSLRGHVPQWGFDHDPRRVDNETAGLPGSLAARWRGQRRRRGLRQSARKDKSEPSGRGGSRVRGKRQDRPEVKRRAR